MSGLYSLVGQVLKDQAAMDFKKENDELKEENDKLKEEVAELKRKNGEFVRMIHMTTQYLRKTIFIAERNFFESVILSHFF